MLNEADFTLLAREVQTRTGALISRDAAALIEGRLNPIARREGYGSVTELIQAARVKADSKTWTDIAEGVVQTDTRFFRDREIFKRVREEILPALARAKAGGVIRIWSAGCGPGQEAYSLAMILDELRSEGGFAADLLATDMSERLLEKARTGLFTQFEIQRGLPIRKLIAYFEKAGDLWCISDRLRASVKFQTHNLLSAPPAGEFDLIFCRHVLTQFEPTARSAVLDRLASALAPGGMLILGAGEVGPARLQARSDGCFVSGAGRRAA
ncbi:MAG: protein-glutamate O-methyltransferase CheR [Hyphomonadaceae bacterium]|nr:protein-glutamate O-methyltransferase CheR [Hyphomonadaceae bacterium]